MGLAPGVAAATIDTTAMDTRTVTRVMTRVMATLDVIVTIAGGVAAPDVDRGAAIGECSHTTCFV